MAKTAKSKGLGRGLSALLATEAEPDRAEGGAKDRKGVGAAPIELIHPNPDQPRRDFPEAELQELARSIAEKGVLQPLLVRPAPGGETGWQIVAGERRWRAAQIAGIHELPIIIKELDDSEVLEIGIIENIQRTDLNPVEEAEGFARLMRGFGHTQERLAQAVSKSRSYIANALRLLTLPEPVLAHLRQGRLSAGHARALIAAEDPARLAEEVLRRRLSVRETEALVRDARLAAKPGARRRKPAVDADTKALEADLSATLGLGVSIRHRGPKGGEVVLRYGTLDELDGLCRLLSR